VFFLSVQYGEKPSLSRFLRFFLLVFVIIFGFFFFLTKLRFLFTSLSAVITLLRHKLRGKDLRFSVLMTLFHVLMYS